MKLEQIDLKATGCFSSLFLDYVNQKQELNSFYSLYPKAENFEEAIKSRSFSLEKRQILREVILHQYDTHCSFNKVKENIDLLQAENTFTITTGHQLNIFTGPLYFVYKIITVVNACNELKKRFPAYNFVPIYWMASEDHDFAEINHFYLYGNKYEWKEETKGAVGRLSPQKMGDSLIDTAFIPTRFKEYYRRNNSLANATRQLVNDLFGKEGLVVVDPDHKSLKTLFKGTIKKELTERKSFELVNETTKGLEQIGYKSQIAPRDINLFYLEERLRERIEWDGTHFKVLNTDLSFTREEMLKSVEDNPEKFSPNVVLRPVYQEEILPNLAYIGGPAEIVYWLQLKNTFDYYKVNFPMLMPRNFALVVNKQNASKFKKLDIPVEKLFLDDHSLKTFFLDKNSNNNYHLNDEISEVERIFFGIKGKAERIDRSLVDHVGAELHKIKSIIGNVEKKLRRAEERNQETSLNQLFSLKSKLFPSNKLQERHDNFLNFYISDELFITKIKELLMPFDYTFNVILEDEES